MASALINRKLNAVRPRRRWTGVYRLRLVCFANESSSPLAIDQETSGWVLQHPEKLQLQLSVKRVSPPVTPPL